MATDYKNKSITIDCNKQKECQYFFCHIGSFIIYNNYDKVSYMQMCKFILITLCDFFNFTLHLLYPKHLP